MYTIQKIVYYHQLFVCESLYIFKTIPIVALLFTRTPLSLPKHSPQFPYSPPVPIQVPGKPAIARACYLLPIRTDSPFLFGVFFCAVSFRGDGFICSFYNRRWRALLRLQTPKSLYIIDVPCLPAAMNAITGWCEMSFTMAGNCYRKLKLNQE